MSRTQTVSHALPEEGGETHRRCLPGRSLRRPGLGSRCLLLVRDSVRQVLRPLEYLRLVVIPDVPQGTKHVNAHFPKCFVDLVDDAHVRDAELPHADQRGPQGDAVLIWMLLELLGDGVFRERERGVSDR